jgi:hypothetical protein
MLLLRLTGLMLLSMAFAFLAYDAARMLATPGGGLLFASLDDYFRLARADPSSSALAGAPWLLKIPLGPALAALGALLFLLGYRRPPPEIVSE